MKVTLINEATGVDRSVTTNESGDYVFLEVPPAAYRVEFEQAGFKKNLRKDVTV